ncbi:MAG: N-acetyltransferase family protein [Parvibaculaceae bacterium]
MHIRAFVADDWPQVWPILRSVVAARDSFTYDPAMTEEAARDLWIERPPGLTVVAVAGTRVLGTAKMGPNRQGPGAHIATASFMVAAKARGAGVGTALLIHALGWARERCYAGMQFNAVAASNGAAIRFYERHGFAIIGTIPGGFDHPRLGRVGLHIMYCGFT